MRFSAAAMAERILPERPAPRARLLTKQIGAILLIVNIALNWIPVSLLGFRSAAAASTLTVRRRLGIFMVVFWPVVSEMEAV